MHPNSKGERRPRLLVLNQYYWPGVEATAHLLAELCEALVDHFDVTVVTGRLRGHPELPAAETRNGVRIVRVASAAYDRARLSRRAFNYLTYLAKALHSGITLPRQEVVLCGTDPPVVGDVAFAVARRHRAAFVVVNQDVFPEVAVQLRRLQNPVLVALLRVLVSFYLRRADRVVAIGERMRQRLEGKGVRSERLRVIPNWVDTKRLQPHPRDNEWARENGLDGRFVVMHSGNVGHAQDLDTLIQAAVRLRDLEDLRVVIVGTGARYAELRRFADELGADNVSFLPFQPRERLSESLSAAHVHVVGLGRGLAGFVVPSRLNGVLSVGRPVIVCADEDSEIVEVVRRAGCGVVVPSGDPAALEVRIRDAHGGKLDLEELGRRGREYAVAERDREAAIATYRDALFELLRGRRVPNG